jgi:hypothetical protein
MLTLALDVALVLLIVVASPWALLALASRAERARREALERQIAVTDAIHRELGAVVAPVVTRRGPNAWEVAMAAPLDRPATIARVLSIARGALCDGAAAATPEISFVLTPQTTGR